MTPAQAREPRRGLAAIGIDPDAVVEPPPRAPPGPDTDTPQLRRHSNLVAAGILLSRISGLVREKLMAYFVGAGSAAEAFVAALRIPNLLQNLLGEGVLSASFIPVYARMLDDGREEDAGRLAGAVAGLLMALSGVLVVVGVVFARPLTGLLAPGFVGQRFELTVSLLRILTPGVGFLVLSAWCLGILNSHRRFFVSYVAPVVWNAAMIAGLVAVALAGAGKATLVHALAWGALAGGALQLLVQLPSVRRLSRGLRVSVDRDAPGVRQVISAFAPVVSGRGVVQLAAYLDLVLASFLATGGLASLRFAQALYLLPISLFGMSVAAAELPALSTMDRADRDAVRARVSAGLERVAFYVVPTTVVFALFGDEVVRLIFGGGEFGFGESVQAAAVLGAYAVGLLPTTASRLLQSSLYAMGDPRTPAKVAATRVGVSVVLGVVLMLQLDAVQYVDGRFEVVAALPTLAPAPAPLRGAGDSVLRLGATGLALGAAAGAWLEWGLLRRAVARTAGPVRIGGTALPRTALAGAAIAAVAVVTGVTVTGIVPILLTLTAAGTTYLLAARLLHVAEAADLLDRLSRRTR